MPETGGETKEYREDRAQADGSPSAPEAGVVMMYATFPAGDHALGVARGLVEAGLAACVNIIPGMTAVYAWEGAIHEDAEVVAIIKTRADLSGAVTAFVRSHHPYTNPAVVVLDVTGGSPEYLAWVIASTRVKSPAG
jgi:periplasmic divalent cation tolerance protein